MFHRGWRFGGLGAESAPAERLSADRLAGFLSSLRSVSAESSEQSPQVEASEQTPATESVVSADAQNKEPALSVTGAKPQAADLRAAESSPVAWPPKTAPTLEATSVARVAGEPSGVAPAQVAPADAEPDNALPADWKKGRHRSPSSARTGIRGNTFTMRRLLILGILTIAVAAAVALALR